MARIFYIDPQAGNDRNSGLTPAEALRDYRMTSPAPGDRVLFRRGSVMRDCLIAANGDENAPVTYSAYGEGPDPVFLGSQNLSAPCEWREEEANVWRYTGALGSEACNLIFDGGKAFGNLRWSREALCRQGEWFSEGGGHMARMRGEEKREPSSLFLYAKGNPAVVYQGIECALWSVNGEERRLATGEHHIVLEDLRFENGGVHGFQAWRPHDLVIRRCAFRRIGGGVWDQEEKIRFGNGVEFWESAENILVEQCLFEEIYDSCVTHQGGKDCRPVQNVVFQNNVFYKYGMAAYECRDRIPLSARFCGNRCVGAGEGFAGQGEPPPRRSEIYPQPMGHHLFFWRIETPTPGGGVEVKGNLFSRAPFGAALYALVAPAAMEQVMLDENFYHQPGGGLCWYRNGRGYAVEEWEEYRRESGKDAHSAVTSCSDLNPREIPFPFYCEEGEKKDVPEGQTE